MPRPITVGYFECFAINQNVNDAYVTVFFGYK